MEFIGVNSGGGTMELQGRGVPVDLSFVEGACAVPLRYETIGSAFDQTARRFAERDALIVPEQQVRWSYAQLKHRVDLVASSVVGWD